MKRIHARIAKLGREQRLAFGRAYTSVIQSRQVVDADGDVLEPPELEKAAHAFASGRALKAMHKGRVAGELVESFVATPEKAAALGLPPDADVAWWVAVRVDDADTWAAVKSGELAEFSFGGNADREPIARPANAWISKGAPAVTNRLANLNLSELSLVPRGAGERVAITVTKERDMKTKQLGRAVEKAAKGLKGARARRLSELPSKLHLELVSAAYVARGEEVPADLAKELMDPEELQRQLAPLAGVMETVAALVDASHAAGMAAGKPAAEAPTDQPEKGEDEPAPEGAAKEEEDEPMPTAAAKAHPEIARLERELAEVTKAAKAAGALASALEAQMDTEKARKHAAAKWDGAPISPDALTTIARAIQRVEKSEGDTVEVVFTRDELTALGEGLARTAELAKASPLLGRSGSARGGVGTAEAELAKRVVELQKSHPNMTEAKARYEALAKDSALLERIRKGD